MDIRPMASLNAAQPVHVSITEDQISMLVDRFYALIRADATLGPLFDANMTSEWDPHLEKMKSFWRSVLLRTREYDGRPVPAHAKIEGLGEKEFDHWLALFAKVAADVLNPEAAELTCLLAGRIATSLWLSRNVDPTLSPPVWNSAIPKDLERRL